MGKSLSERILIKIKQISDKLSNQNLPVTKETIFSQLSQVQEYQRHDHKLLNNQIEMYFYKQQKKMEETKVQQEKQPPDLNKSLPMRKKRKPVPDSQNEIEDDIIFVDQKKLKKEEPMSIKLENIPGIEDLGGIDEIIDKLYQQIYMPLHYSLLFEKMKIIPPKGILLTGPPGSGKTAVGLAICKDIYQKFKHQFYFKPSTEIIGALSGESEKNLRNLFQQACDDAPSIIFIDEIDAIAGSRDKASKEMERRVVSELLSCLDKLPHNVFVIASTSRPESLEMAIRRGGRFDNEVLLPVPDEKQRHEILKRITKDNPLSENISLLDIAKQTPGYVPADLVALVRKAGMNAVQRVVGQAKSQNIDISASLNFYALANNNSISSINNINNADSNLKNEINLNSNQIKQDQQSLEYDLQISKIQSLQKQQSSKLSLTNEEEFMQVERKTKQEGGGEQEDQEKSQDLMQQNQQKQIDIQSQLYKQLGIATQEKQHQDSQELQENISQITNLISIQETLPVDNILDEGKLKQLVYELILQDFELAVKEIQPTGKREGFAVIPNVTWDDIGGLQSLKQELINNIILPITQPEKFEKFNITSPAGVLLYGPPGCGKTLLAKAVANASRANFIAVKGPELLNKYVGESERSVRQVFQRAKSSAPCIIFFDEIDALCPKRGSDGNQVTERVVNALLAEMDGFENRKQVYVIAATNRPDIIDQAMLRGGRLDKLLYVPLPDKDEKVQILKALTRKTPICESGRQELNKIAYSEDTEGFTGADLASFVKESAMQAILNGKDEVTEEELWTSLKKITPSLSDEDRLNYQILQTTLRQAKGHLNKQIQINHNYLIPQNNEINYSNHSLNKQQKNYQSGKSNKDVNYPQYFHNSNPQNNNIPQ